MNPFVDTHAHVDLPEFDNDRPEMFQRAWSAGIMAIVVIAFNPERWRATAELAVDESPVRRVVGVHPNDAAIWSSEIADRLRAELDTGVVLGIGETGLDFARQQALPEAQREAFAAQLDIAMERDIPVVIHQREAGADVVELLSSRPGIRGVMHCFSGDLAFARRCLDLGFYLGVGGLATYPKSSEVRDALSFAPLDRLVLETDAPYLAPQRHRGKRNEPAWIVEVAATLAELRAASIETVAQSTTDNAVALFGPNLRQAVDDGMEKADWK